MPATYKFEGFELDVARFELRRNGHVLKLEKIPMELLLLLVSKPGELVSREEIIAKLWDPSVFIETEHGINTAMRKIRQTLGDNPEQPRFVQTVVGKGYRFIAQVTSKGNSIEPADPVAPASRRTRGFWHLGAAIGIAVLAAIVWMVRLRTGLASPTPNLRSFHSVAVLPLENLSGDPSQEYFADGITDALITQLAKVHGTARNLPHIDHAIQDPAQATSGHRSRLKRRCRGRRFCVSFWQSRSSHGAVD